MPQNIIHFFPNFSSLRTKTMVLYLFKALIELGSHEYLSVSSAPSPIQQAIDFLRSKQVAKVFKKTKIQVFPKSPLWLLEALISFLTFHTV